MEREPYLAGIKIRTSDLSREEDFFSRAFGFAVTHRYADPSDTGFDEIVMASPTEPGLLLKFIQYRARSPEASGITIQFRSSDCRATVANAVSCGASVVMAMQTFAADGVHMAVVETTGGLQIELVEEIG